MLTSLLLKPSFAELPEIVYTSGGYTFSKNLIAVPGSSLDFNFAVEFQSRRDSTLLTKTEWRTGKKWLHSYQWQLLKEHSDSIIAVYRPDGGVERFLIPARPTDKWMTSPWVKNSFKKTTTGYLYETKARMKYTFDKGGRLLGMLDPTGLNELTFTHAPVGIGDEDTALTSITDTRGNQAFFTYSGPNMTSVTYKPKGVNDSLVVRFDYIGEWLYKITDVNGDTTVFGTTVKLNLLTVTNNDGRTQVYNDFADNRLVSQVNANGDTTRYSYIKRDNGDYSSDSIITITNSQGVTTTLFYDSLQQITTSIDSGSGAVEHFRYNDGLPVLHFHPVDNGGNDSGYFDRMSYDNNGNMIQMVHNSCEETEMRFIDSYEYIGDDENGDPIYSWLQIPDPNSCYLVDASATYLYGYDAFDRPVRTIGPNRDTTFTHYFDSASAYPNLVQWSIDPLGRRTQYSYTTRGLLYEETGPDKSTTRYDRSAETGDLMSVTDVLGNQTSYQYDPFGRNTAIINALGDTTRFVYDRKGRTTIVINAMGDSTITMYDCEDRIVSVKKPGGAVTVTRYTPAGEIAATLYPTGDSTTVRYDSEGRPITTTDQQGRSFHYTYNKAGRLTEVIDNKGQTAKATYDIPGNLTSVTDVQGNTTTYQYDLLSRPIRSTDPSGNYTTAEYDVSDRINRSYNARKDRSLYRYDNMGNLISNTLPGGRFITIGLDIRDQDSIIIDSGTAGVYKTSKVHDALGRLASRTDVFGKTISYHYDAAGNIDTLVYSDGKKVAYRYDALNRLLSVTDWAGRITFYTYDKDGNVAERILPDGSVITVERDTLGRIVACLDRSRNGDIIYKVSLTLNEMGFRTAMESVEPLQAAVPNGSRTFTFDNANRLLSADTSTFTYDADGNMILGFPGTAPDSMQYNAANQLINIGNNGYRYDAEEVRVEVRINGKTVRYVQDIRGSFPHVLEETDTNGTITARYVYGFGLISQEREDGISIYHFDVHGNTCALTNAEGTITDRYAYTPFGASAGVVGTTRNPFRFGGREGVIDDGNSLYYMRTRYYSPHLMRFIQRDRKMSGEIAQPQTLNSYAYVLGNPVNFNDHNGEWFGVDDALAFVGGAAIGAAAQFGGDLVNSAIKGKWEFSSAEEYAGATLGGGLGTLASLYVGPVGGAMVGAAVQNGTTQGLNNLSGKQSGFNYVSFGTSIAVAGAFGSLGSVAGKTGVSGKNVFYDPKKFNSLYSIKNQGTNFLQESARGTSKLSSKISTEIAAKLAWSGQIKVMGNSVVGGITKGFGLRGYIPTFF